jgi:clusterin-associated protein 1
MRSLGYNKPLGIDSFDAPSFGVMASLLHWLTSLYDPEIVLMLDLSSELSRVEFVRSIAQQMAVRSGIRLNPRKLYASDRYAVRELLKLATPVYRGIVCVGKSRSMGASVKVESMRPPVLKKIGDLADSVPKRAVELYDELEKELMIRETRNRVLTTLPPLDEVEKSVLAAVRGTAERLETLTKDLQKLNSDRETLQSKIVKKKQELDRQQKRLMSVQTIRPAFMDDYERLEQDLQELFTVHFRHYRNVDHFEHELAIQDERRKVVLAEAEKNLEKMRKKYKKGLIGGLGSAAPQTGSAEYFDQPIVTSAREDSDDSF